MITVSIEGHDWVFCVNHYFQKFFSYIMTTRTLWRGSWCNKL